MVNTNFRKFTLSSGREILAGKNAQQNDLLVSSASRKDTLLHTSEPGSPFVNVGENPSYEEIIEASVYCAMRSQDFRNRQGDVKVNIFLKEDCFKDSLMRDGTWGVRRHRDTVNVDKIDILRLQHDIEAEMEEE